MKPLLATPHRHGRPLLRGLFLAWIGVSLSLACSRPELSTLPAIATAPETGPAFPGSAWERIETPESIGYSSERLEALRLHVSTLNTTGLMVVVDGRVLFEYGDVEQLSYLASVRKSILAMLYGNYVADGTIRLDKTLSELGVDDHGGLLPVERRATIDNLITARSGVYHRASNSGDNSADAPERGSQRPGDYFLYNNWDFNAAGAVFELETGIDIYDALERDLALPLDMQDFARTRQRKTGNLERSRFPAYHMWLSTRDMARIGHLMLHEGEWAGTQVIPREWARRIVSVVTPAEDMNPPGLRNGPFGYGYMWWVWDEPWATDAYAGAYSGRGAYGQYITVLPALDMVVAHKTAIPPERSTSWRDYAAILDGLVNARCDGTCQ